MFKVPNGQDPYSAIGKYIRDHITAIEDIIAVIKINEVETNQLFMVDINEENYFIWENDWWEGEEDITLIDFFPVSEAQRTNQSAQSDDTISRRAAIEAVEHITSSMSVCINTDECHGMKRMQRQAAIELANLPPAQPEDICSECDAWNVYKNYAQPPREKGRWIFVRKVSPVYNYEGVKLWGNEYKCSRCGYRDMAIEDFKSSAFCPNCGIEMEVE